jgi:hypothetical protein
LLGICHNELQGLLIACSSALQSVSCIASF